MRRILVSAAIAAALAASAAQADVSVCVNNRTGKARFATKCGSNEAQEFLGSSAGGGHLRTIRKKVDIPKGTIPGRWVKLPNGSYVIKANIIGEISCRDDEFRYGMGGLLDGETKNSMIGMDAIRNPAIGNNWCDIEYGEPTLKIMCGSGDFGPWVNNGQGQPTNIPFSVYMVDECMKK